jgi:hypothetical protein
METEDELFFTGFTFLTSGLFNTVVFNRRWMEVNFPVENNAEFYSYYFED